MERYESDYSDDFEEEELSSGAIISSRPSVGSYDTNRMRRRRRRLEQLSERRSNGGGGDRFTTPSRHQTGPPPSKSQSTGVVSRKPRQVTGTTISRHSLLPSKKYPPKPTGASPAREKQLSAMNHALRGLQNKLAERERQLEEVSKENRLLTRIHKKQEKEWNKIHRQEDELPQLLRRHEQQVKSLKQQLRKSREEVLTSHKKIGELQDDVRKLSTTNQRLEAVAGKKSLLERDQLTVQVQLLSGKLAERQKRVLELERGLEMSGKTHLQEIKGLRSRNKTLVHEAVTLRNNVEKLHSLLKEKTREMEVMNIYTQRMPRTSKPSSPPPSPSPPPPPAATLTHQSSQTALSCPPFTSVSMQHRPQLKATASQTNDYGLSKTNSSTQTNHIPGPMMPGKESELKDSESVENVVRTISTTGKTQSVVTEDSPKPAVAQKQDLLQRLRELDGQKRTPSSNPLSPTTTHTSISRPLLNPTPPPPPPLVQSTTQEQEKKNLLLAKLIVIDEGGDPNRIKPNAHPTSNHRTTSHGVLSNKSTSSLTSWPEVVENMHHGRPAHASEDDPFGSRTRLNGVRRSGGRDSEGVFLTDRRVSSGVVGERQKEGYRPSFGRRATQNPTKPHPLHPDEAGDNSIGMETPAVSRSGLLPRRPKADSNGAMRSNDVMPGAIISSEPDDLEELVL